MRKYLATIFTILLIPSFASAVTVPFNRPSAGNETQLYPTDNVGISTSSPFARLSVQANNGDTNQTLFAIASSTASATSTLFSVTNTGTAYFSGNVGIGITNPTHSLQVGPSPASVSANDSFTVASTSYGYFSLSGTAANSNVGFALNQGTATGGSGNAFSVMGIVGTNSDPFYGLSTTLSGKKSGDILWQDFYSTAFHAILSVPNGTNNAIFGGNVGIGTSTPTASLTSVAASSTVASTAYQGLVSIIAGLENNVTKLFEEIDQWGHLIVSGDAPTLTACTGGSVGSASNDRAGVVTIGTGLTTCGVLFAHAYPAGTTVHVFLNEDSGTIIGFGAQSITTAGFTIAAASVATGDVVSYEVIATQ